MSSSSQAELTYDLSLLRKSMEKWKSSEALRKVYGDFYGELKDRLQPGLSIELGSGIGTSKEFIPDIVTSDLTKTPYVDRVCSAYDIGCPEEGEWANIIAVDVLHHLCRPMDFFASAAAALNPGGRIILCEPAASIYGKAFYKAFHPEPIEPALIIPPFEFTPDSSDGMFANMGMAYSLFYTNKEEVEDRFKEIHLRIREVQFRDVFAYPLTGGYSGRQLAPVSIIKGLLSIEKLVPQWIFRTIALRMLVTIEKC